jgi:non-specific serine/threonine protein kinase
LIAAGEELIVQAAHAAYFLSLAETGDAHLRGPEQMAWLERLEVDHPNLRAALTWYRDVNDLACGLRLAGALGLFWAARGHLAEGRLWLESQLAKAEQAGAGGVSPATTAKAASAAGTLAFSQGDHPAAIAHHTTALRAYRAAGDAWGIAYSLKNLGVQALLRADEVRANELLRESLEQFRTIGDPWGTSQALMNLGVLALDVTGDLDEAKRLLAESLSLARRVGDPDKLAVTLVNLGEVAGRQGADARAEAYLAEALTLLRSLGDQRVVAYALGLLGSLARRRGDMAEASAHLAEGLRLSHEVGAFREVSRALETLAEAAAEVGQPRPAARLLGAAELLRERIGAPLVPTDRAALESTVRKVRAALGEAGFAAVVAEGRAWTLEEAVVEGESAAAAIAAAPPSELPLLAPVTSHGLTPRELDVLRLLAEGRSDKEIGAALFISHRTATKHVANILAKLGVGTRTAAAAIAHRDGFA